MFSLDWNCSDLHGKGKPMVKCWDGCIIESNASPSSRLKLELGCCFLTESSPHASRWLESFSTSLAADTTIIRGVNQ